MDIGEGGHRSSPAVSVVIDDLHVVRIAAAPAEADTPLVVDPEAAANGVRRTSLHRFTTIPEAPDGVEPGWAPGAQLRPLSSTDISGLPWLGPSMPRATSCSRSNTPPWVLACLPLYCFSSACP